MLEVSEIYRVFLPWQFGEFDFIDSIKPLQNGSRTVFPLRYNETQLMVVDNGPDIIAQNILLIFVNGVVQGW